jgi:hypothetical protein
MAFRLPRNTGRFFLAAALCFLSLPLAASPWLEREDEYFRYAYQKADEQFLEDLQSAAKAAYETATGYLRTFPAEKPVIVLYGNQDDGTIGGYFSPLPMHIGQMANYAQEMNYRGVLTHELTHYLQAETKTGGYLPAILGFFSPDYEKALSLFLSDVSLEGSTSFIDGYRRSDRASLAIRAAVIEGRMWNFNQISTASVRYPSAYRVYLSGMLIQDWLYDTCGDDALTRILESRGKNLLEFESEAVEDYTGLSMETAWGDIRARLNDTYAFARTLPAGVSSTPRDSANQPQWGSIRPTARGMFQYRTALNASPVIGFWRPDEKKTALRGKDDAENKAGVLAVDPGVFIPVEGLVSDDTSIDADGSLVAAIINQPAKTGLAQAANKNELWIAKVEWSADGERARATKMSRVPGTGFSAPALSPDGKRLFALRRFSDMYRATEIDPATGSTADLDIPKDVSVYGLSVAPDGKKIAVAFIRQSNYDIGIYDLETKTFTPVTDDAAMDFAPRFLADGALAFSSDRENTIAIYRYENGNFSRECIDRIGAWAPASDGRGGYYFSSMSADGYIIRHLAESELRKESLPGFAALTPNWVSRRDSIWEHYRKKGEELAKEKKEKNSNVAGITITSGKQTNAARRDGLFIDIAKPVVWQPIADFGYEGGRYGLALAALSNLGENAWDASLACIPEHGQIAGSGSVSFTFPQASARIGVSQNYYGSMTTEGTTFWNLNRDWKTVIAVPIARAKTATGTEISLSTTATAAINEKVASAKAFSFAEGFGMTPARVFAAFGGLEGAVDAPAPALAFLGGTGAAASIQGLAEKTNANGSITAGCIASIGAGCLIKPTMRLRFDTAGGWRQAGGAHELFPRMVPRWDGDSDAPGYGEFGVTLSTTSLESESANLIVSKELAGTTFGIKTFAEASASMAPRWRNEAEISFVHTDKMMVYYTPILMSFGVGYRATAKSLAAPSAADFSLRLTFYTSSIAF